VSQFEISLLSRVGLLPQAVVCFAESREGSAMTVENPNAKSIWTTIEIDKDGVETVLVVETDLELNAADPAFDVAKVDALIDAAMKSFAASGGTIDRVHLVPVR
jgi:Fe-S cluster assembly iron-binding protein IscA